MDKDYQVEEIKDAGPGEKYQVTFQLPQDEMGKALIEVGYLRKVRNLNFCTIDGRPVVQFRLANPIFAYISPVIQGAEDIFQRTVAEVKKFQLLVRAIQLVEESHEVRQAEIQDQKSDSPPPPENQKGDPIQGKRKSLLNFLRGDRQKPNSIPND